MASQVIFWIIWDHLGLLGTILDYLGPYRIIAYLKHITQLFFGSFFRLMDLYPPGWQEIFWSNIPKPILSIIGLAVQPPQFHGVD